MAKFDRSWESVQVMGCDVRDKRGGGGKTCALNLNPQGKAWCSEKQAHLWPQLEAAHKSGAEIVVDMMEGDTGQDGSIYWCVMGIQGVETPAKPAAAGPAASVPTPGNGSGAVSSAPRAPVTLTADQRIEIVRSLAIMMSAGWIIDIRRAVMSIEDYASAGMFKTDGIQMPERPRADTRGS